MYSISDIFTMLSATVKQISMRKWLRGRASPCQGEGRGFESRLPLHKKKNANRRSFFVLIKHIPFNYIIQQRYYA